MVFKQTPNTEGPFKGGTHICDISLQEAHTKDVNSCLDLGPNLGWCQSHAFCVWELVLWGVADKCLETKTTWRVMLLQPHVLLAFGGQLQKGCEQSTLPTRVCHLSSFFTREKASDIQS